MPMHQPTIRRRESHAAMRLGWGDMARSPAVANLVAMHGRPTLG